MRTPTLGEVLAVLDEHYDPAWAEAWDAVGLVCGDPEQPVRRVLLAIDPVAAVAEEAVGSGVDLLVVHHPLYLRPTSTVAATTPKGRLVHRLIGAGTALHVAHTNADVASPGVSDALAEVLGLRDVTPLVPALGEPPAAQRNDRGLGRVGRLTSPMSLGDFADLVERALPATAHGVRVAGDRGGVMERVAVMGGAGDGAFDAVARSGADVYLTADLRHHPASEERARDRMALVDVAHWASEWPWLPVVARRLVAALEERGATVEARVSTTVTDPWDQRLAAPSSSLTRSGSPAPNQQLPKTPQTPQTPGAPR